MLRHIHRCATRLCLSKLSIPGLDLKAAGSGAKNDITNVVLLQRMLLCTTADSNQETDHDSEACDDLSELEMEETEEAAEKQDKFSPFKFVFELPGERKPSPTGNPYPEDVDEKDPVLRGEITKYHRGRRWLANIMGKDPETFSQKDVDEAIEYLLPSHMTAPDARPQVKHPYEVFPALVNTPVDEYGRPKHPAFFMRRTIFHDLNFQIWSHLERLDALEEDAIKKPGVQKEVQKEVSNGAALLSTAEYLDQLKEAAVEENESSPSVFKMPYTWVTKKYIENSLKEPMSDEEYTNLTFRLSRLANHKFFEQDEEVKNFLKGYIVPTPVEADLKLKGELSGVHVLRNGEERLEARAMGYRKSSMADLTLRKGDGTMTVNNKPVRGYFSMYTGLEQIMHPFLVTDTMNEYDFDAQVLGGGTHGQAGAIRHALSRALVGLDPDLYGVLTMAGLLRKDTRKKERIKPGLRKARRAHQWVAR